MDMILGDEAYNSLRLPSPPRVTRLGHGLGELPVAEYPRPHDAKIHLAGSPSQYRQDEEVTATDVVVDQFAFLVRVRMSWKTHQSKVQIERSA